MSQPTPGPEPAGGATEFDSGKVDAILSSAVKLAIRKGREEVERTGKLELGFLHSFVGQVPQPLVPEIQAFGEQLADKAIPRRSSAQSLFQILDTLEKTLCVCKGRILNLHLYYQADEHKAAVPFTLVGGERVYRVRRDEAVEMAVSNLGARPCTVVSTYEGAPPTAERLEKGGTHRFAGKLEPGETELRWRVELSEGDLVTRLRVVDE